MLQLIDANAGDVVVAEVEVVRPFGVASARGLLGRCELAPGRGLLLSDPLRCIHTFGMRFAIDVVFLDADLRVVGIARDVAAGRVRWHRRGSQQLELRAGAAAEMGLRVGRRLRLRQADPLAAGGRRIAESPRAFRAHGEPAHSAPAAPCGAATRLRSMPPATGSSGVNGPPPKGPSPCAPTC